MTVTDILHYRDNETALQGYLAYDDAIAGTRPGVILAPEAPGPGDHVKRRARLFAESGFIALVLDIYGNGRTFDDMAEMMEQVKQTRSDINAWRQRIRSAVDALRQHPLADQSRLFAVGYCFGGTGVLEIARSGEELAGIVCFHGELTPSPHAGRGIISPILVLTGAQDPFIPREQRSAFEDEMNRAGCRWDIMVYGGAKHGFTNPEADHSGIEGMAFGAETDALSWNTMMTWMDIRLGKA